MWRQTVAEKHICNNKYTIFFSNFSIINTINNYTQLLIIFIIQSGDTKAFVVIFVATERMWLDTTDLNYFVIVLT